MSTKKDVLEEESIEEKKHHNSIFDLSRNILLAGVGAVVLAEEEITGFVDKLVERGEVAEKDARKLVKDVLERRDKVARERQAENQRNRPVTVATKSDIDTLNARIVELTEKLEELKKNKAT